MPLTPIFRIKHSVLKKTGLVVREVADLHNVEKVTAAIKASIMSKQLGYEDFLATIVAEACSECTVNEENIL